jgi:hypothetical protein
MRKNRLLLLLAFICTSILVASCGGGSNSTTTSDTSNGAVSTSASISGTAAAGAPLDGATIVIKDSSGATVGTTTAGTDGAYKISFNPSGFTAPFVISASGNLGGGAETFVSVAPTSPTAGSTQTVNVTPVTHAIAARVSTTGNPNDLVDSIASQKGNITTSNISTIEGAFRTFLDSHLTSVGLNSSFNLLNSTYNSNIDKLLDNVKFDVSPSGIITVTSSAGQAVNDLAASNTKPAAGSTAVIAAGSNPTASDKANIPAPSSTSTVIGIDAIETIRASLDSCMLLPTASRSTSTVCSKYIISDYKNDGKTLIQEFGSGGSIDFTSSGNDGMVFKKPEILRQIDMTKDTEIVQVRLTGLRKDGSTREVVSIAKNNISGAGTGWKLTGNGRDYNTFVNAAATKRISQGLLNSSGVPTSSRYESDLNLFVASNSSISYVKVKGPGLPTDGIYLMPKSGCDFLTITPLKSGKTTATSVADLADPNAGNSSSNSSNTAYSNQVIPCSSLYRFQVIKVSDGSDVSFSSNQWLQASPQKTNAEVLAINANDLYQFEIHKTDNTTLNYWNRLRAKPLLASEIKNQVKFVDFTDATKALMTSGGANFYVGGNAPTVSWTTPANTALPFKVTFFHPAGSDEINIPYGSASTTVPCSGNTECNGTNYVSTMGSNLTSSSQYVMQLLTRNRFDLQILTQLVR